MYQPDCDDAFVTAVEDNCVAGYKWLKNLKHVFDLALIYEALQIYV